jgi:SAM-dependent methyltransferase
VSNAAKSRAELLASEKEFHNRRFQDGDSRAEQLKYYWSIDQGAEHYRKEVERLARGADVLEYGCGAEGVLLNIGSIVRSGHAIDISEEGIAVSRAACPFPNVQYAVMDAMNMEFGEASFDLVFGSGIVHHLDTVECAREIARVLRPGGHAVFWEPCGRNPLINAYRYLTPDARTPDEHPLLPHDMRILAEHFSSVDVDYYGMTSMIAVPFRHGALGKPLRSALWAVDSVLTRIPGLRTLAWYSLIRMVK